VIKQPDAAGEIHPKEVQRWSSALLESYEKGNETLLHGPDEHDGRA